MNDDIAHRVLRETLKKGVSEFCICPGARNSPFVFALAGHPEIKTYYWFEERSAAFFALGRSRASDKPVAVITTSGSAAAELLPATMEAYYTGVPLLLITADRPRRFRGTGAPQTAEQVGLFGCYASFDQDLALDEDCLIHKWTCYQPAHLNICFEEPHHTGRPFVKCGGCKDAAMSTNSDMANSHHLESFLSKVQRPFVVVSALKQKAREPVCAFLQKLNAPVLLEGPSGLREDPRLNHLKIKCTEKIFSAAAKSGYPIDGVLRLGGVPTNRLWRDLEDAQEKIDVCSVDDHPFSGLSRGPITHGCTAAFFADYTLPKHFSREAAAQWMEKDDQFHQHLIRLFKEEPLAEASLIHELSKRIPKKAKVYLGNSLPIREWDLAADWEDRHYAVTASRGINGIDGQISTFLGLCEPGADNWAIIGDLTALYDMAGPWILSQLNGIHVNIVIINNSGGQIFWRKFAAEAFLNKHNVNFAALAALWNIDYERWTSIPHDVASGRNRLIEIVPDAKATDAFWRKLALI